MRLSTDHSPLHRRVLRTHLDETTKGADIELPGDTKGAPQGLLFLWLLTVVGLLLYFIAAS